MSTSEDPVAAYKSLLYWNQLGETPAVDMLPPASGFLYDDVASKLNFIQHNSRGLFWMDTTPAKAPDTCIRTASQIAPAYIFPFSQCKQPHVVVLLGL